MTQFYVLDVTGEELSVGNISYSLTDDGEFEVVFGTNYSVTVSTLFGVLKYSFGIDLDLQSRARGLMGELQKYGIFWKNFFQRHFIEYYLNLKKGA